MVFVSTAEGHTVPCIQTELQLTVIRHVKYHCGNYGYYGNYGNSDDGETSQSFVIRTSLPPSLPPASLRFSLLGPVVMHSGESSSQDKELVFHFLLWLLRDLEIVCGFKVSVSLQLLPSAVGATHLIHSHFNLNLQLAHEHRNATHSVQSAISLITPTKYTIYYIYIYLLFLLYVSL